MRVPPPAWAERAKAGHYNAVENLVCFAPLVLIAGDKGINVDLPALAYLIGRLVHFPAQAIGPHLPMLRTAAFAVSWASCIAMGAMIIMK